MKNKTAIELEIMDMVAEEEKDSIEILLDDIDLYSMNDDPADILAYLRSRR